MMFPPRPGQPMEPHGRVPGTLDRMPMMRGGPMTAPMPNAAGPGGSVSQNFGVISAGLAGQQANLAGATPGGNPQDSMLVHVTPKEYAILSALSGGAKINPVSGLPAFWGAGDGSGAGVDGGAGVGDGGPGGPGGVDGGDGSAAYTPYVNAGLPSLAVLMNLAKGGTVDYLGIPYTLEGMQAFTKGNQNPIFPGVGNVSLIADALDFLGGGGAFGKKAAVAAPPTPQFSGLAKGTGPLLNSQLQSSVAVQKILGQLGGVDFGFGQ